MATNVVAFVGENENGILAELSCGMARSLASMGLRGHVIDLHRPGWSDTLEPIARQGIAFAWGYAGVGAALEMGGDNLWDMLQVPFISVLADAPSQLPANHCVRARFVANGYLFRDWLEVQRRFIRSPQISAMLPPSVPANPQRDVLAWARRPHRMVFVKTGDDPARRMAEWDAWPAVLRAVLHDATSVAAQRPTGDITEVVLDAAIANGLHLEERLEILFALFNEVDRQTRALRATAFARALLPLPAIIIGRGWDHLDLSGARASLRPAVPAEELPALYAGTQFLVSTNPNFAHGVHERPVNGFAARACVVSDENAFSRERFASLPSFFGLDWTSAELEAWVAAIFHRNFGDGPDTTPALAMAEEQFGPVRFLQAMSGLAALVLAGNRLERFER